MKRTSVQSLMDSNHRKNSVCVDKYPDQAHIPIHASRPHHRSKSVLDGEALSVNSLKEDLNSSTKGEEELKSHANKKHEHNHGEDDVERSHSKLREQKATKGITKHAFPRASSISIPADYNSMPQNAESLINDIASLELEVVQLEQHLLSLYRKAFEFKSKDESCAPQGSTSTVNGAFLSPHAHSFLSQTKLPVNETKYMSGSLSSRSSSLVHPFNGSKPSILEVGNDENSIKSKLASSYSQPIQTSIRSEAKSTTHSVSSERRHDILSIQANATSTASEGFDVGHRFSPNKLSEELVRCMAAIFCKLADPPIPNLCSTSPTAVTSSTSLSTLSSKEFSAEDCSPYRRLESPCTPPTNPCQERNPGKSSRNTSMISVLWINAGNDELRHAKKLLENFKFMVRELEGVDPRSLKHEEKLAFWLNIFNALMMHAYLAYGIPENHQKRMSLSQKASYKIGAYTINAHTIEHRLLCCKSQHPAQWIQSILSPVSKLRAAYHQAYALERPEPLVCFAICHGGRSDPAVRVYTVKNVYQELEVAKREFVEANVMVKGNRIYVARLVESFARGSGMGTSDLMEWISWNVEGSKQREVQRYLRSSKSRIEWVPYNSNFRYLFAANFLPLFLAPKP